MVKVKMKNKKVTISKLCEHEGKVVKLYGWVYNTRNIGKFCFLIFRVGPLLVLRCLLINLKPAIYLLDQPPIEAGCLLWIV